jgi:hypothetical protein
LVSNTDIGWVAGIVEGEGCIVVSPHNNTLRLSVEMTDLDVLQKLQRLLGPAARLSKRTGPLKPNWKTRYILHLCGSRLIQWLQTIYPLMGARRKTKIEAAIAMFKARPNRPFVAKPRARYQYPLEKAA